MLSPYRFGFRPSHAAYMPLLNFTDIISTNVEENKFRPTIGIFLDQTKTFDIIDHNLLLSKLKYYDILRCHTCGLPDI